MRLCFLYEHRFFNDEFLFVIIHVGRDSAKKVYSNPCTSLIVLHEKLKGCFLFSGTHTGDSIVFIIMLMLHPVVCNVPEFPAYLIFLFRFLSDKSDIQPSGRLNTVIFLFLINTLHSKKKLCPQLVSYIITISG